MLQLPPVLSGDDGVSCVILRHEVTITRTLTLMNLFDVILMIFIEQFSELVPAGCFTSHLNQ